MNRDRALTIYFLDGTHISFDFPMQRANDAARGIMLDESSRPRSSKSKPTAPCSSIR